MMRALMASLRGCAALGVVALAWALPGLARADDTVTLDARIDQHYEPHPQVGSAGTLVGLIIGPIDGKNDKADPSQYQLPLSSVKGAQVCIRAMTSDAKYWSSATVTVHNQSGRATIKPDKPWKYISDLTLLPRSALAVIGFKGTDCIADDSSVYVPVAYPAKNPGSQTDLHALFAAPRVALIERVEVTFADRSTVIGKCSTSNPNDPSALGFNVRCTFSLPSPSNEPQSAKLDFVRYDRTGERTDRFDIVLP